MSEGPLEIFVVDDNPCYTHLVELVLKDQGMPNFTVLHQAEEALTRIAKRIGEYGRERSYLVLLDVRMIPQDGFRVLKDIRANAVTALVPVVMMSNTFSQADVQKAYRAGANSGVAKPLDLDGFNHVFYVLCHYWEILVEQGCA